MVGRSIASRSMVDRLFVNVSRSYNVRWDVSRRLKADSETRVSKGSQRRLETSQRRLKAKCMHETSRDVSCVHFFWVQNVFEFFYNEFGCKNFSNFFTMNLAVNFFGIFFTMNLAVKFFRIFFTLNLAVKTFRIFFYTYQFLFFSRQKWKVISRVSDPIFGSACFFKAKMVFFSRCSKHLRNTI